MKDSIYGPKFKELRKEQNITLVQAARGITSKSTLSLWENGNDNLSFSQVLKLLNKINIQPIEFIDHLISADMQAFIYKIDLAYVKSDVLTLHKYAIKAIKVARQNPQDKAAFLKSCIADNFYQDLSNNDLLTKNEKERLANILSNISEWNYADIFYFCNSTEILPPHVIYRLSMSLINYSANEKLYLRRWYSDVLNAILNSISNLTRHDYHLAESLLNQFNKMNITDRFAYEKIHAKAFHAFIIYIKTKNEQEVDQLISNLDFLNLPDIKDGVITGFKQIKQIYG